ncbi:MAG: CdaR family protein, partial [Armatimonadota bacterium]
DTVVPGQTEVTVRGPASRVREVARGVVVVDTSGLTESIPFPAEVEPRNNRNLPVGGVEVEPSRVTVDVKVRPVHVKHLPVRPRLGTPPSGYRVVAVVTEPSVVTVTSDQQIGDIEAISTLPVDISGLRGTKSYSVSLNVPSGLSVTGPAAVAVTVTTARPGGETPAPGPQGSGSSGGGSGEDNAPQSGNQQGPEGGDQAGTRGGGNGGGDGEERQDDSTVTPGSEGSGR